MDYEIVRYGPMQVMGIPLTTANQPGKAEKEIPAHWARFHREELQKKIPGRTDDSLLGLYTDYEGDYTKPYTLIIGCRVNSTMTEAPSGMQLCKVPEASYAFFPVKGPFPESIVSTWQKIWNSSLPRAYSYDIELYPHKEDKPIQLYIALGEDAS